MGMYEDKHPDFRVFLNQKMKDDIRHWSFISKVGKNWSMEAAALQDFEDSDNEEETFKFGITDKEEEEKEEEEEEEGEEVDSNTPTGANHGRIRSHGKQKTHEQRKPTGPGRNSAQV